MLSAIVDTEDRRFRSRRIIRPPIRHIRSMSSNRMLDVSNRVARRVERMEMKVNAGDNF